MYQCANPTVQKSLFFLQNQAGTIQTQKKVFENSFLAMFISQVSSKLRDKHCQITRISTLPKRNFQTGFYGSVNRISHYTSVFRGQDPFRKDVAG